MAGAKESHTHTQGARLHKNGSLAIMSKKKGNYDRDFEPSGHKRHVKHTLSSCLIVEVSSFSRRPMICIFFLPLFYCDLHRF